MEIHKLKDEISEGGRGFGGELKITDIRQGVKNPERVNIFINGKYEFSLSIAQVVDLGIKVGRGITSEELGEFKRASEFGKIYQRALEWALIRPRSTREARDYLVRKLKRSSSDTFGPARRYGRTGVNSLPVGREMSSEDILQLSRDVMSKLVERGYVDDEKFARFYVENRFVKKGVSSKRLKMELMKKGVKKEVIEKVMGEMGRDDENEIRKMIARKRARYDDEKLMAYLCRQGFSYDLVREMVEETRED